MGVADKIKDIEEEMARTQKNKATEHHMGLLKARLAKLRLQQIQASAPTGGTGVGFDIRRSGDARVALMGFPSVGKSSILSKLTNTFSLAADYEFTTTDCKAGHLYYDGYKIQLLDLPGIIKDAHKGMGKGKQVISTARSADLIIMVLDISKTEFTKNTKEKRKLVDFDEHVGILQNELSKCGVIINQKKKNVVLTINLSGGININKTNTNYKCIPDTLITAILKEYKIFHCLLQIRENISVDDMIDAITNRNKYINCIYVFNKADKITKDDLCLIGRKENQLLIDDNVCVVSVEKEWNIDGLKDLIINKLGLIRIYTKKRGQKPDLENPIILKVNSTIKDCVLSVHSDMLKTFKNATVWGRSVKYMGMRVGLKHIVEDEDVVQIN